MINCQVTCGGSSARTLPSPGFRLKVPGSGLRACASYRDLDRVCLESIRTNRLSTLSPFAVGWRGTGADSDEKTDWQWFRPLGHCWYLSYGTGLAGCQPSGNIVSGDVYH